MTEVAACCMMIMKVVAGVSHMFACSQETQDFCFDSPRSSHLVECEDYLSACSSMGESASYCFWKFTVLPADCVYISWLIHSVTVPGFSFLFMLWSTTIRNPKKGILNEWIIMIKLWNEKKTIKIQRLEIRHSNHVISCDFYLHILDCLALSYSAHFTQWALNALECLANLWPSFFKTQETLADALSVFKLQLDLLVSSLSGCITMDTAQPVVSYDNLVLFQTVERCSR